MTSIQITYLYPSSVADVALVHRLVPYLYRELRFHQISGLSFGQGCLSNGQYHFHSGFPPPLWYGLCFMVSWYIMFQVSLLTLPFPLFTCHASAGTIITHWLVKYSLSILPPSDSSVVCPSKIPGSGPPVSHSVCWVPSVPPHRAGTCP